MKNPFKQHRNISGICYAVVLFMVAMSSTAYAAVVSFTTPYSFSIDDTNPSESTLTIDPVTVTGNSSAAQTGYSISVNSTTFPPTLITKDFTITATLDPSMVSFSTIGPLPITVRPTGTIVDVQTSSVNPYSTVVVNSGITGNWTLTGPTESVSGNFSLALTGLSLPKSFDAANYPNQVTLTPVIAHFYSYFYPVTVDDVEFIIGTGINVSNTGEVSWPGVYKADYIGTVPIPATFWLFGSGLLGLIGVARRKGT